MQRMTRVLLVIAIMCALVGSAQFAYAQNATTGTLVGVVMDAQKAVLPGATVVAVHVPTGTTYETVTQADGRFTMLAVRVGGPYKITASMAGFKAKEQTNVQVALGESQNVEFVLALQTVQESVTVVAEAQLIDTTRAGAGANIASQAIESLPSISRSINDFARTSPMVNVTQDAAQNDQQISVAGRHNRYNNMLIDGAVNNDVFGLSTTGTPGGQTGTQPISLDVVQEIQVLVSPYDVRQGGFSGGGVNVVTKTGTNNFHGTGYYFARNQKLIGAIPAMASYANPSPADSKVGTFKDAQYGGTVGGPVLKNKLFFLANADWARKTTPVGYSLDGSSGSLWNNNLADVQNIINVLKNQYGYTSDNVGEISRPNNSNKFFGRFDFNLSSRNQLTLRVNYVDANFWSGTQSAFTYNMQDHFYYMRDKMLSSVLQLNSTIGSSMFNELRVTYQRERNNRSGQPGFAAFPEVRVYMPGSTSNSVYFGTEYSSMANKLNQDIIEFTDDVTIVKGDHTFSIGTHNEFYKFYNLFIQNFYGAYTFQDGGGYTALQNLQSGLAQQFYHYFSNTANPQEAARFNVQQFGLYAGDKWRVANNFTLTYGLRVDFPHFPQKPGANPQPWVDFGYGTDVVPHPVMWSPRAGFNWDLSGGSAKRSQLRGGVGMFSGRTPYVWLSNQYGNTGVQFTNISTNLSSANRIPFVTDPFNQPTTVVGANTSAVFKTINVIDPNYSYPAILRSNLAYDRDLGFLGLVGSAEIIYSKTLKDIRYKNLNMQATGVFPDGRFQWNGTGAKAPGTAWSQGNTANRPDPTLGNVLLLTNTNKGYSWAFAAKIERPFKNGWNFAVSYLYGDAYSVYDGTSSVANSNFTGNPVAINPNDAPLARSNFSPGGRFNVSLTVPIRFAKSVTSSLSIFYNLQSGRPFDLRASSDMNGDSASGNDLLYFPASASGGVFVNGSYETLVGWLQNFGGNSMDYLGKIMPRNALRAPSINQLDMRYAIVISTPGKTKVELTADMSNVLNFINKNWGWQWWGPFPSTGGAVGYGVDTTTGLMRYDVKSLTSSMYGGILTRDDLRSRWQAQFGIRFRF